MTLRCVPIHMNSTGSDSLLSAVGDVFDAVNWSEARSVQHVPGLLASQASRTHPAPQLSPTLRLTEVETQVQSKAFPGLDTRPKLMFSLSLAPLQHLSASEGQPSVDTYRDSQPEESGIGCESLGLYAGSPWRVPRHTSSDNRTAAVLARPTTQQHVDILPPSPPWRRTVAPSTICDPVIETSSTSSQDVTSAQHSLLQSTCNSDLTRFQLQSQRSAL